MSGFMTTHFDGSLDACGPDMFGFSQWHGKTLNMMTQCELIEVCREMHVGMQNQRKAAYEDKIREIDRIRRIPRSQPLPARVSGNFWIGFACGMGLAILLHLGGR